MKKNLKVTAAVAAALLAVAPIATSVVPTGAGSSVVQAADGISLGSTNSGNTNANSGSTVANAPTDRPYFTFNNQVIAEATSANTSANVVRTTVSIKDGEAVSSVTKKLNDLGIKFYPNNNSAGQDLKLTDSEVTAALAQNGITTKNVSTKGSDNKTTTQAVISIPSSVSAFNLTLTGTSGSRTATIQVPVVTSGNSSASDNTSAPVFHYSVNGTRSSNSLNGQVFQVAVNSNFNATNFTDSEGNQIAISADQNANNTTSASITSSGSVNTSEAGRYYNVTLTATGLTGQKTSVTYTVLVAPSSLQTLHAASGQTTIPTYNIYGNNVLSGSTTFKDGQQVYVGDQARTINGVSYSRVSTKSKNDANASNVWVMTSALVTPAATETSEAHTVMIESRGYDKNGNFTGNVYPVYSSLNIVPKVVTINGKTYYKIAGKDEYVRVTNITGTQRKLTRNAYIYWSSYRRTPGTGKMYRGQTVTTYGAAVTFKNGKKYYKIQGCAANNKRYIKAVNFY